MAAVTYTDGTIREYISGETKLVVWVSPSTMDSGDTVTPTAVTGKTLRVHSAWDHTTGDAITATISSGVVTLDAAGATTNHEYSIVFTFI